MNATEQRDQVRRVVEAVAPSVVRIGRRGGRGCGFVVDQGIVVTNAHNLRDRTTEVTFADGRATQARATGVDVDGDLAVLEVDTGDAPPLTWAESQPELGDPVFALARTAGGIRVTSGSISGVERSFRGPRGRRVTGGVEHTAPLARGSSGSPVVDQDGVVVGITTLRLGDGFFVAIPAGAELTDRLAELRAGRAPHRRMLGVALAPSPVARRMRRAVGLPDRDGVLVRMVEPGSPAERAGLQAGDLITTAGSTEVTSVDDLAAAVDGVAPGDPLPLKLVRGTDEVDVVARLDGDDADDTPQDHGEA